MSSKRILLFGAAGQVGQALQQQRLPEGWQLEALDRSRCDITDHRAVQAVLLALKPDFVVNAAGMTAVDACEKDYDAAMAVNFEATANLASQCSTLDITLLHISTDYVFDGKDGGVPYTTAHKMSPLNVYGHSKMMGEEAVRHTHPWHIILRISSVFSEFGDNLLPRMLQSIDTRDQLKMTTDQIIGPTYAPNVAAAIVTMLTTIAKGKFDGFGTFHLCGEPAANRLEFARAIMQAYAPYTTRRPEILPALTSDFPGYAERPVYSMLDCSRIRDVYGITQHPWRDDIVTSIKSLMRNRSTTS